MASYIPYYEPAALKAKELCENAKTDREKYDAVTKWLNRAVVYDYVRATKAKDLTGPDIARCFELKLGICMDIASLAVAMFRAVGLKANVVFGWATLTYTAQPARGGLHAYTRAPAWHAWAEVYLEGKKLDYDQMVEQRNLNRTRDKYTATYRACAVHK